MNKKEINKILGQSEQCLSTFYDEMKWILNSKRGKKFQFMMLSRTYEALIYSHSRIRDRMWKVLKTSPPEIKSPLDD